VRRYRVILPVVIKGKLYAAGAVVELELGTAVEHAQALIPVEVSEVSDGRED
jgi:hypothetical protein